MRRIVFILLIIVIAVLVGIALSHKRNDPVAQPLERRTDDHVNVTLVRVGPQAAYPKPELTPGAIDPNVTEQDIDDTICVPHYTATVRPSSAVTRRLKLDLMRTYAISGEPSDYELDHFIPLELGGCSDCVANLWPEPYEGDFGAREKDIVENHLHHLVCKHAITLSDAQAAIVRDWVQIYLEMHTSR